MVLETKDEILDEFNTIVKTCTEQNIKYRLEWHNFSYYARIYFDRGVLQINESKWKGFSKEKKMQVMLHEAGHIGTTSRHEGTHKVKFWKKYIQLYDCVIEHENKLNHRYDWDRVAKLIVKDVIPENIDRRQTTTGEMRERIENALGVEVDDRYPREKYESKFKEIGGLSSTTYGAWDAKIYLRLGSGPNDAFRGIGNYTNEELWKFFVEVREEDPSASSSGKGKHWVIPKPSVEEEERDTSSKWSKDYDRVVVTPCTSRDSKLLEIVALANTSVALDWDAC